MSRITRRKLILVVIVLAAIAALVVGIAQFVGPDPTVGPAGVTDLAVLTIFSGQVSVMAPGDTDWMEGSDNMPLQAGDRVRTDADSYALITFLEGSTFEMDPETEVSIVDVEAAEDGSTTVKLKQWVGRSWSRAESLVDAGSSYEIESSSAVAAARGTLIGFEVGPDGTTIARVFEGKIGLAGHEEDVLLLLGAGKEGHVGGGQPLSSPHSIAPPVSQLRVSITSSALMQLIDPHGRSAGVVPPGIGVNQIPNAITSGSLGEPQTVEINNPAGGAYTIILYAQEDGTASLEVEGISHDTVEFDETLTLQLKEGQNYQVPLQVGVEKGLIVQLELGEADPFADDVAGRVIIMESVLKEGEELDADFVVDDTVVTVGQVVEFTDLSSSDVTSWYWDFGDGQTSNEQNPKHIYTSAATYSVSLVVFNGDDVRVQTKYVMVYDEPKADFGVEPSEAAVGQSVWFEDLSIGNPSEWLWDFGDGETSEDRYPSHSYDSAGIYTVSLTVSNPADSDTVSKEVHVDVSDTCNLTTSTVPSGGGTISPEAGTYQFGDTVQLTAAADPGWTFSGWSGDLTGSANPETIIITGDTSVTATFTQDEYTLAMSAIGSGSATTSPDEATYHYGDTVQLTATADLGWTFSGWSGDLTSSANPETITIMGDMSVIATFTQDEYTLTTSVVPSGGGAVDPETGTYTYGTEVILTATPAPGYRFIQWAGDISSTDNPVTITVDGNTNAIANFIPDSATVTYELSVGSSAGGSVTDPGQGTFIYEAGATVALVADSDTGYGFDHWEGDVADAQSASTTITMDSNKTVTAIFTQDEYTLTVNTVGDGSVARNPNQSTYHYGDLVELTATAGPGWTFSGWSGGLTGSENPETITITGNTSVTATFTQDEYTLTVNIVGGGSVARNPDQSTYHYGDTVELTATADRGWTFSSWSGDLTGSANPDTVTITGNMSVTATFVQGEYTLTVNIVGAGNVARNPDQSTYHYGDEVELTATADRGWTFSGWSGDLTEGANYDNAVGLTAIADVSSSNPATITITITGNMSVTATFTQNEYILSVNIVGNGSVATSPDKNTYHYGDIVQLTATADPRWTFSGWSGDLTGGENPETIVITGNTSVTATFTRDETPEQVINELKAYIRSLPDDAFKHCDDDCDDDCVDGRRMALQHKLNCVLVFIHWGAYEEAIEKLRYDIRAKADGSVDGHPANDWITDPVAQEYICERIDYLIAYLET